MRDGVAMYFFLVSKIAASLGDDVIFLLKQQFSKSIKQIKYKYKNSELPANGTRGESSAGNCTSIIR